MTRTVTAVVARTQFGQIVNRAVERQERFLVERNGKPSVLILSVDDFVKMTETPPDWLKKSWESAGRHGLDKLTPPKINAEVTAARHARHKPV
jgi:prevent-host-death family protein